LSVFTAKLVDHTGSTATLQARLKKEIQGLFDQLFNGSSDSVTVDWGTYAPSDRIVLHFVPDIQSSYILQQFPGGASIPPQNSGYTRTRGNITGSEFYKHVFDPETKKRSMLKDIGYAKAALHEAMHNQYPYWTDDDMHGTAKQRSAGQVGSGGGGLAGYPPTLPITARNQELMQKMGIRKIAQLP
jgi:hypothetical protein